jgi:tripartite-type tricarboxylate transporter receptor subunit TctC
VDVWYALLAPSATPRPVLEKLNAAVSRILHAPDAVKKFALLGLEPVGQDLAATDAYVKSEIAKWAKVVKAAGITAN